MALSQRLDLRQSQALVMTPQLQQAIKLLQLSNIELASYIEGELEQNPLLERDEGPAEDAAPNEPAREELIESWDAIAGAEGEGKLDLAGDPSAWKTGAARPEDGDLPGLDQTLARATTLREHLLAQLAEEVRDPADRVIGAYLVDQIDEAGYLTIEGPAAAE